MAQHALNPQVPTKPLKASGMSADHLPRSLPVPGARVEMLFFLVIQVVEGILKFLFLFGCSRGLTRVPRKAP